ncbi:hypothetical protein [Hellea balneolensis]|uniref:hypothetical protein n=1 Tax=Hellea balneolensis TaxID=287478 RepID=UPI0004277E72|nr:hypothetical protein [Hellea balneolensis]
MLGIDYISMDALYDFLSYLPETVQPYVATLLIIIIGYFISKIFMAIVVSMVPIRTNSEETTLEGLIPIRTHLGRICFWVSWLFFIIIGTNQVHSIFSEVLQSSFNPRELMRSLPQVIGACLLLMSEKHIAELFKTLKRFCSSVPVPKNNPVFRFIIHYSWIPILLICVAALNSPKTVGYKAVISLLVLCFGWLFSNVLKQAILSTLNLLGLENEMVAKFVSYFVFIHFLIAAINI